MKRLLFFATFLFAAYFASSQNISDTITIQKRLGTSFIRHGKMLTPAELKGLARPYPLASQEMKRAMSNYTAGSIFSYTGGFLIGYPLGVAMGGGKPVWAMAAVGAGFVALSIPFSVAYTKHAKKAVRMINGELIQSPVSRLELKLSGTSNGAGLVLNF